MSLPCKTCKSECCGTVPVSQHRLDAIKEHLAKIPSEDYAALAGQKRKPLDCAFIDTRTWTCAVYPVRPALCCVFGNVDHPLLHCPKDKHPAKHSLTQITAKMKVELDGDPVTLTHLFKYENREEPK